MKATLETSTDGVTWETDMTTPSRNTIILAARLRPLVKEFPRVRLTVPAIDEEGEERIRRAVGKLPDETRRRIVVADGGITVTLRR